MSAALAALTPKACAIYRALVRAAEAGVECPKNSTLCEIADVGSVSYPATAIGTMERLGLIKVVRYQRSRQVTITATGKSTAEPIFKAKHWRDREVGEGVPQKRVQRLYSVPLRADLPDDDNLPPAVDRDPCPRCGVRRDHGCEHGAQRIAVGFSL